MNPAADLKLTDLFLFLFAIQVTLTSRELSGQDLAKFYDEITNVLRVLVQSADSDDKLCGVLIIGKRAFKMNRIESATRRSDRVSPNR